MVSLPDVALGERAVVRELAGFGRHDVILPERNTAVDTRR